MPLALVEQRDAVAPRGVEGVVDETGAASLLGGDEGQRRQEITIPERALRHVVVVHARRLPLLGVEQPRVLTPRDRVNQYGPMDQ